MPLGFFYATHIKNIVEFAHYAPDILGGKTAVFQRINDIAPASSVAPWLGKQGCKFRIIFHFVFLPIIKVRSAALIFLTCHKTTILGATLPHKRLRRPGGASGQLVLMRIVAVGWPTSTTLTLPTCGAGVDRSSPRGGKSRRTRRPAPRVCSGPPLFSCGEDQTLLSYTKDTLKLKPSRQERKNIKIFFSCVQGHA